MKFLNICLSLTVNSTVLSSSSTLEQQYQSVFKPVISYLYENPSKKISFSFSGPQLDWLEKNHVEFLTLLRELINKKQVELIGGGYYNPIFPLLQPIDRNGQIEMMTQELRRITGKRPRGISVLSSVWDNSLISSFHNSGMEWIQLDSSLIPSQSRHYLPHIINDKGKTIKVFPVYRTLEVAAENNISAENFLSSLLKQIEKATANDAYNFYTDERVISLNVECDTLKKLIENGWLQKFNELIDSKYSEKLKFTLPTQYLSTAAQFIPSFIGPGLRDDIAKWTFVPYEAVEVKNCMAPTINNFLFTYKRGMALYQRMLHVSMLISNCHGDKARKNEARKSLWKAQSGEAFICSPQGIFANNAMRQSAYRSLTEAEKYIREASDFQESISKFDYNFDGHDDYVCSMEKYTALINPKGGQISELNIIHNTGNYADNLNRIEKFDKVNDEYNRGLFIEHVFSKEEFASYKKGLPSGCGIFSKVLFKEQEFNAQRKEIRLRGDGTYSLLNLPVSLRKKYIMNSNGFTVQYILKNEGPIAFKGNFVVESNFAQTDFSEASTNSYKVDLISSGNGITYDQITKPASQKDISFLQITDTSNNISFVYEPNEEAGISCRPLYFKRPVIDSSTPQIAGTTFVSSLFWDVDLPAGRELEKTINFTIITPKKRRTKK